MTCFTIAPVPALVNFSFNKNKVALVRITAAQMADSGNLREVLVSDMWSLQGTETETEVCNNFKKEVQETMDILDLNAAASKKRTWTSTEDLVDTFYTSPTKRICTDMSPLKVKPAPIE